MIFSPARRAAAARLDGFLARLLTGPGAFLLGGLLDTAAFATQSLWARSRRRAGSLRA